MQPRIHIKIDRTKGIAKGETTVFMEITPGRLKKSLGIKCNPDHFKDGAKNFEYITKLDIAYRIKNRKIKEEYERVQGEFTDLLSEGIQLTAENIREVLSGGEMVAKHPKAVVKTLYVVAMDFINTRVPHKGTRKRYQAFIDRIIEPKYKDVLITRITANWLRLLEDHIRQMEYLPGKPYAPNTIWGIMKFIRTVVNHAMDRMGVKMEYPFGRRQYQMQQYKNPKRNYLTEPELARFAELRTSPDPVIANSCRWFLLQAYSGMRHSDLLLFKPSHIRDGRLYITDKKEQAHHFIPMYKELQEAIDMIERPVFAYDVMNRTIRALGSVLGIPFTVTTHTARHSFAIHHMDRGGSREDLQLLLGHSDIRTTAIYGHVTDNRLVEAVKRVRG